MKKTLQAIGLGVLALIGAIFFWPTDNTRQLKELDEQVEADGADIRDLKDQVKELSDKVDALERTDIQRQ